MPATEEKYSAALAAFSSELAARGLSLGAMAAADVDWALAEAVVDRFEEDDGHSGIGAACTLVAAVSRAFPQASLRTAWRALDVWRKRRPPVQAPAFPPELAYAIVTWLVWAGQPACAAAVVLCFGGLLRASEALTLTWRSLLCMGSSWIVILGRTKRGLEQRVILAEAGIFAWLSAYAQYPHKLDDRVCNCSYSRFQSWLRRAAGALGFGDVHWTSHGLRRGGATALLSAGHPLPNIMLYGRWTTERSCREYLRRGEVAVLRMHASVDEATWQRVHALASVGAAAFGS